MEDTKITTVYCEDCGKALYTVDEENGNIVEEIIPHTTIEVDGETIDLCEDCLSRDYDCCDDCNEWHHNDDITYVDGRSICESCLESGDYAYCDCCGDYHDCDDVHEVHVGGYPRHMRIECWCEGCCCNNEAFRCEECGEYFDNDHRITTHDGGYICDDCADRYYVSCGRCGDLFRENEASWDERRGEYFCDDCFSENTVIYGYHDYPAEFFKMDEPTKRDMPHIGIELEIDCGGEDDDNARKIAIAIAGEDFEDNGIRCSRDGSLDDGFEIISNPATLEYHANADKSGFDWKRGMEVAAELGYKSHDHDTCGLHVHVDREYFAGAMEDPEAGFAILFQNNMEWLKKFSRRKKWSYCAFPEDSNYAFEVDDFKHKKEDSERERITSSRISELKRFYHGHGAALNFDNYATIELRLFRGTLKYSTFLASLQFVYLAAYAVKHFRYEQLCNVDLKWFKKIAKRRNYAEFLGYVEERGIMQ